MNPSLHIPANSMVQLFPLKEEHRISLWPIAQDPDLWTLGLNNASDETQWHKYMDIALEEQYKGICHPFAIYDVQNNRWAGSTRFANISNEHKRLEIGWTWIGKEFQGSGLNKACKFELLRFAFEDWAMNRVEIKTDVLNTKSRRAIEKLGAREEGIFRHHCITWSGRLRDTVYYSILKEEWARIRSDIFAEF